jgi:hypothetical protein
MMSRFSRLQTFLVLGGVLCLCCLFFAVGRRSGESRRPVWHATHEMNELDRLQQQTASQR